MIPGAVLASALEYAARGWAVFPILPHAGNRPIRYERTDMPVKQMELNPVQWEQWATTDPDKIIRTWTGRAWGIAIACGPSRLLVVETEPNPVGYVGKTALMELAAAHGPLPSTWTVSTPTGGISRYYQQPSSPLTKPDSLEPRIFVRAAGQYTIAPPTSSVAGTWDLLINHPVANPPDWLVGLLTVDYPK